jgi:hypothetical protein
MNCCFGNANGSLNVTLIALKDRDMAYRAGDFLAEHKMPGKAF